MPGRSAAGSSSTRSIARASVTMGQRFLTLAVIGVGWTALLVFGVAALCWCSSQHLLESLGIIDVEED